MIYGVFIGYYSDWRVLGYFDNKEDAEKYIAFANDTSRLENYYILPINNMKLNKSLKESKLNYYHEIVFDYRDKKFIMRDEPDRYEVTFESKPRIITFGYNRWISFELIADTRKKAEKICQDLISEISYNYSENNDIIESIKNTCPQWEFRNLTLR